MQAEYGEALFRERDVYSVLGVEEALRPAPAGTPSSHSTQGVASAVNRVVTDQAVLPHRDAIDRLAGLERSSTR
jgi:hypothetical protein